MNMVTRLSVVRVLVSVLALFVFAGGATTTIFAQGFSAKNDHLAALRPAIAPFRSIVEAPIQVSHGPKRRWLTLNNLSIATLIAGEAIDSWGTYENMTHSKWICGQSSAFEGVYDTNAPDEISGIAGVQTVCGPGPGGQLPNWAFDATRAGYFSEGGWAARFHLAGDRNYAGVEAWNLVNDVAWALLAHRLERRRGWIGKLGPALNFGRGIGHLELGIENLIMVSHDQDPNTLDLHVPKDSNYTAPRWWGKS